MSDGQVPGPKIARDAGAGKAMLHRYRKLDGSLRPESGPLQA